MAYFEFIWTPEIIAHIVEHGLTPDDFEHVFANWESKAVSRSSGRPMRFSETVDGRYIAVVFEWIESDLIVLPVTAYEV